MKKYSFKVRYSILDLEFLKWHDFIAVDYPDAKKQFADCLAPYQIRGLKYEIVDVFAEPLIR